MGRTKRKTTIAFDSDNFVKLQNIAAMQNRTITNILNELIEGYVQGKLPEGYEERIKDQVFALVDQRVESDYLEALAEKVAALLSSEKSTTDMVSAIDTMASTINPIAVPNNPKYKNFVIEPSTYEQEGTTDTARTDKKRAKEKPVDENTRAANIAKFKRYEASANKKSYNDQYVASQEGFSNQTVWRYRQGKHLAKQDFIDKWGLNWNGKKWIKN